MHTGPHCKCHGAKLFDFTMCKRTHHADCSFEEMCARAHVPLHEALGEPVPATWKFTCPSCGEVFDSTAGGHQKLDDKDEELEKIAGCTEPTRKAEALKYADKHDGIMHGQYGVSPCHHVVVEPMAATTNSTSWCNPAPALAPMPTLGPTAASTAEADRAALHTTASGVPNEHVSRLRRQ